MKIFINGFFSVLIKTVNELEKGLFDGTGWKFILKRISIKRQGKRKSVREAINERKN